MVDRITWGTDGEISLPKALSTTNVEMVDMEGFCFTPDGLRLNLSLSEREDLLRQGYGPSGVTFDGNH